MIINMTKLRTVLMSNITRNTPTMIWGAPGVGKSTLPKEIANDNNWGFKDVRVTLRDPVDLRGLPMVDQKTGTSRWLPPDELPNEKRDGKRGILLLDELPQAAMAMQNACFSLVLDRYLGEYKLPPGWAIIAAGNRIQDRSGAQRMNKALANRFAHFEVTPELAPWCDWCARNNINPLIVAYVRWKPTALHYIPDSDDHAFPTPRSWVEASKHADETDQDLRKYLIGGIIGDSHAAEFETFARTYLTLPSIDEIFKDPDGVRTVALSEPGLLFALATGLSRRVDKNTISKAHRYLKRINSPEHETTFMLDTVARDASLKETKSYSEWFVKNSRVMT